MKKVVKFGGSSVSGAEQFRKGKAIVESDPARKYVVISAAGKRSSDDHKLTDLLYLCHAHLTYGVSCDDIWASIENRFYEIRQELGLKIDLESEFAALRSRLNKSLPVDELVSRGEYLTSRLMAEYLGYDFVDAASCIFFGLNGQIDKERTYAAIAQAAAEHERMVIPGFYGRSGTGRVKVMSRGGSDITGSLVAAATGADVYENWTDVSGILMADPRIVSNPRPIQNITYAELRELAFMGASVLHEESVEPVKDAGIPLNIRNTNRPEDPGTMILEEVAEDAAQDGRFITGISGKKNFNIVTVSKHNLSSCETLRQALAIFDRFQVPVEHITLGLDSFAVVASEAVLGERLDEVIGAIQKECLPDRVEVKDNIALVAAVGRKMSYRTGTSGQLFHALGKNGINIRTIAQGADELAIIVGVDNAAFEQAIRVLYQEFAAGF